MQETWTDNRKTELTFSLEDPDAARRAADRAIDACHNGLVGFTLSGPNLGGWNRIHESSYTLAIVGPLAWPEREAILAALFAAGCEAIQVEWYESSDGYRVAEVRA